VSRSGAELFARFAYPPNELGYCGPADAEVLLDLARPEAEERISAHARQFEGAWTYLQLIADAAGIRDPLDLRVVEAYWIGNDLLDRIEPERLVAQLQARFPGQTGANWVPGRAHHGFHVFAVYPWVGMLRNGRGTDVALGMLEQCRIRWGEVTAVLDDRVRVRSRPLVLRDGLLALGEPHDESPVWSAGGRSLLAGSPQAGGPAVGEQVALHFDWVCAVLHPEQAGALQAHTLDQLARTNTVLGAAEDHAARGGSLT
jgi:hypothetical protein